MSEIPKSPEVIKEVKSIGLYGLKNIQNEDGTIALIPDGKLTKMHGPDNTDVENVHYGNIQCANTGSPLEFYLEQDDPMEEQGAGRSPSILRTKSIAKIERLSDGSYRITTNAEYDAQYTEPSVYILSGSHFSPDMESQGATEKPKTILQRIRSELLKLLRRQ